MTRHDDEKLADWLAAGPHQGPAPALDAALARARAMHQRPAWVVGLSGGTISGGPRTILLRYALLAMVAVLVTGLIAGALVVGSLLPSRPAPSILAIGSTAPSTSAPATPAPSTIASELARTGLVAYTLTKQLQPGTSMCPPQVPEHPEICTIRQAWVSARDGSAAHALLPDDTQEQEVRGWSADGSRLLVVFGNDLVVMDPSGGELARLPIGYFCKDGPCTDGADYLCVYPCAGAEEFALSPDGTRVAFVRAYPDVDEATVIAVLDLASGTVTELTDTRTTNGSERCWEVTTCQGLDGMPRWSPDGRRIAFDRQVMSPEQGASWTSSAIFVVDADGRHLQRVTPAGMVALDPGWSADGSQLVFTNIQFVVNADHTSVLEMNPDIYTIGLGGDGLVQLTNDGISARPTWTTDGRLAFMRGRDADPAGFANWIMDPDGGNQSRTGESLPELTAAGCTRCPYPLGDQVLGSIHLAYWQPTP